MFPRDLVKRGPREVIEGGTAGGSTGIEGVRVAPALVIAAEVRSAVSGPSPWRASLSLRAAFLVLGWVRLRRGTSQNLLARGWPKTTGSHFTLQR
jgi:hypothetical protein